MATKYEYFPGMSLEERVLFDILREIELLNSGGGGGAWGSITGTLSNQTDLQTALDLKESISNFQKATEIYFLTSGTDTYTATPSPAYGSYSTGMRVYLNFGNANTGAATINLNGLGAKAIKKSGTTALSVGDIAAGQTLILSYDGTNFQVIGGGGSGITALTGDITASGVGSVSSTISANAVTYTKSYNGIQNAIVQSMKMFTGN